MGIDLKDILRIAKPVAKGAIAAKVGLMAKEREREDTAIEEAEGINANTVQTGIQTAQTDLANTKTIQNETYNLMESNYKILEGMYGADRRDDLALLYFKDPSVYKMQNIRDSKELIDQYLLTGLTGDIVGEGVDRRFVPGADITAETPQIQNIYQAYGQDATVSDIISQQRGKFNEQVNAGLVNLSGKYNTKLLIDDVVQPGAVREKRLAKPEFTEGRVAADQFMTSINDIVDQATMQDITKMDIGKMSQTVNWAPRLTMEDVETAALNAIPGSDNQSQLLREQFKFNYYYDVAKTMKLQQGVETTSEAIDIMRADGTISRDSVMSSINALDRAVLDRVAQIEESAIRQGGAESQFLAMAQGGFFDPDGNPKMVEDINGNQTPLEPIVRDIRSGFRQTAELEYTNQGYYDLFNRFVNVGDDPQFDLKVTVPVKDTAESPFVDKQITAAINPQILSDGGLQIVDKNDIFETVDIVDSRDLFGVYSPDGSRQLIAGDSGVFSNMDSQARDALKEQVKLNSGGMDAIMPFITMSQEEFDAYQKKKKDEPKEEVDELFNITESSIMKLYETIPPQKIGQGRGAKANPAYTEWVSNNKAEFNASIDYINNIMPVKKLPRQKALNPEWKEWNELYKDILKIGKL